MSNTNQQHCSGQGQGEFASPKEGTIPATVATKNIPKSSLSKKR